MVFAMPAADLANPGPFAWNRTGIAATCPQCHQEAHCRSSEPGRGGDRAEFEVRIRPFTSGAPTQRGSIAV